MLAVVGCLLGLCLNQTGPGLAQATSSVDTRAEQASAAAIASFAGPGHVDTAVVSWEGSDWLATAVGTDEAAAKRYPMSATVDVQVFRWVDGAWAVQGVVSLADLGGPPPIELHVSAVALAGLGGPNFEVTATQYGLTSAAVIAAIDGSWRAVPFALPGGGSDTVIDGTVNGGRVGRITTFCAPCTVQPAPTKWYQYERGAFAPAAEPGPPPPCRLGALPGGTGAVTRHGGQVTYTKLSCQGGFALATGAQGGHQVAVLFQRIGTTWSQLAGNDQIDWAAGEYGLQLSVLQDLAAHVGPAAKPAVAAASIFGHDADIANYPEYPAADSSVVERDNAQWFAAAGQADGPRAGFVASIYRWDGSAWAKVGSAPLQLPDLNGPGR